MDVALFLQNTIYPDLNIEEIEARVEAVRKVDIERKEFCLKLLEDRKKKEADKKAQKLNKK